MIAAPTIPIDCIPSGALVTDRDGVILGANEQAAALLRRGVDELRGLRLAQALPGLSRAVAHQPLHGRLREFELCVEHAPQQVQRMWCSIASTVPSPRADDPHADIVVCLRDIGAVIELREQRRRLMQLAGVRELLPTLLHELRNPLSSIQASVELLLEDAQDPAIREELQAVYSEIGRLDLTLQGLGVAQRQIRSSRSHDLAAAITDTCRVMERLALRSKLTLSLDCSELVPLPFDPRAIQALVFNLVSNAIAACDAGAGVEVRACLERNGGVFLLEVRDTGRGMPPEVVGRCTELFYTTKARGSGIGLALCQRATDSVFGALTINSRVGVGTTVSLRLPLEEPIRASRDATSPSPTPRG